MFVVENVVRSILTRIALFSFDRPRATLILTGLAVLLLSLGLGRLSFEASTERLLHEDHPGVRNYNAFRDLFHRGRTLLVALEGDPVFDPPALGVLRGLHRDLSEKVPHLSQVTSLINVRQTRVEGSTLTVDRLLRPWPETLEQARALERKALGHRLYRDRLVSGEGNLALIVLELESYTQGGSQGQAEVLAGFDQKSEDQAGAGYISEAEKEEAVAALLAVVDRYRARGHRIHLAGRTLVSVLLKKMMARETIRFLALTLTLIALALAFLFRRLSGLAIPLLVVVSSLLATLGLMGWCGVSLKLPSIILPSFILAVGVSDAVHILSHFFANLGRGLGKREALGQALDYSGRAVLLTSLTTAAGFFSFAGSDLVPIAEVGVFAGLGALLAMLLTLLMVPAAIGVLPLAPKAGPGRSRGLGRALSLCADLALGRPVLVSLAGLALVLGSAWGLMGLRLSHDPLAWLPAQTGLAAQTRAIDQALGGTVNLEVVLDSGREDGLHDPAVLGRLDRLTTGWEGRTVAGLRSGRAFSLSEVVKEINQALNEDRPEAFIIPDNRRLISQELLVFEAAGPEELAGVVDPGYRTARLSIALPWRDAFDYLPFIRALKEDLEDRPETAPRAVLTGQAVLFSSVLSSIMSSSIRSYLIALGVISLIMVWVAGGVRLGLAAMVPNLGPVVLTLGVMGFLGFPFDLEAMLIFSVALGLVVDDTIHLILGFRENSARGLWPEEALRQTLLTSGRAIVGTSLVLGLGFLVFGLSSLTGLSNFGLLTALAIFLALIADLLLAPALIRLLYRDREKPTGISSPTLPTQPPRPS